MRALCAVALAALAPILVGCGGEAEKVDTKPFEAAVVEYLRVNSMQMKPEKFESITLTAETATAKVRMATADEMGYGLKPLWTIEFKKEGDKWVVTHTER